MSKQNLPLTGIRVIDYSHFLAGPFMCRCLAALGAEVIKVERPKAGDAGARIRISRTASPATSCSRTWASKACASTCEDKRGLEMMHKLVADRRRIHRELSPGCARTARSRLRGAVDAQSETDLLLGLGLWPYRSRCGAPGLRPDRRGEERRDGADRHARRSAAAAAHAARRHVHRHSWRRGDQRGALGRVSTAASASISTSRCTTAWSRCTTMRCSATSMSAARSCRSRPAATSRIRTVYGVFPAKDGYLVIAAQVDDAWNRLAQSDWRRCARGDERFSTPAARNAHYEPSPWISYAAGRRRNPRGCLSGGARCSGRAIAPRCRLIDEVVSGPANPRARHAGRAGSSGARARSRCPICRSISPTAIPHPRHRAR